MAKKLTSETFTLRDEATLMVNLYKASGTPKGSMFHIHGLSEHSGRYKKHWSEFAEKGFNVLTFDQRGHGLSSGRKGVLADWNILVEDMSQIEEKYREFLGENYTLFGHSMGGGLSITCVLRKKLNPKKVMLSAPALKAGSSIPLWGKIASPIVGRLLPYLVLPPVYDESVLSTLKSAQEDAKNDSLFFSGSAPRNYITIFGAGKWNLEHLHLWEKPTLLMYGAQDPLTDIAAMREFYDKLPAQISKQLYVDPDAKHEILNDLHRDEALSRMLDFMS